MVHGTIVNVLDKLGYAKDKHRWGREVFYNRDFIMVGRSVLLHYNSECGMIKTTITSKVVMIVEDSESLTLYTENSIYYIEKLD